MNYTSVNEKCWDKWVSEKYIWTLLITYQEFIDAKNGHIELYLTPLKSAKRLVSAS